MSLDASINNVGEYYSSHYLAGPFSNDVKSLIAQWREQGSESVPSRIRQLSSLYFRAKAQALEEDAPENRFNAGGDLAAWHSHLLESLGYAQRNAADIPVEGGKAFVPAVARITRYNQPWLVVCETFFCLPSASLKEGMPSEDPLGTAPFAGRLCDPEKTLCRGDWERLVGRVFTEENSPRWIVFLAGKPRPVAGPAHLRPGAVPVLRLRRTLRPQPEERLRPCRRVSERRDPVSGRRIGQGDPRHHRGAEPPVRPRGDGQLAGRSPGGHRRAGQRVGGGPPQEKALLHAPDGRNFTQGPRVQRERRPANFRRGPEARGPGFRLPAAVLFLCGSQGRGAGHLAHRRRHLPPGLQPGVPSRPGADPAHPRHRAGPLLSRAPENPVQHHPSGVQPQARLSRKNTRTAPGTKPP